MKFGTSTKLLFSCISGLLPFTAFAQEDIPSPTGAPEPNSDNPVVVGNEQKVDEEKSVRTKSRDVISGTGFLLIAPQIDGGYLSTSPKSSSIFSKIESNASGWLIEPKIGIGLFSEKIALELLAGAQFSELSGTLTGQITDFSNESPDAPYEKFETPKENKISSVATLVEGSARLRLSGGEFQIGASATTAIVSGGTIYSPVSEVGLPYSVMAGPQIVYESRSKGSLFRLNASSQFGLTGNQRNVTNFRAGISYSILLNSPFLTVREKKIVRSKTTVVKKIVTVREQTVVEKENVKFIFDSQTINFKFGKAELSERSGNFVQGLAQIFAANRSDWQRLTVEGHTDSKGNPEFNKRLSQQRAQSVKNVLVQNGLSEDDIRAVGYGKERLLKNPEVSEIDFARNRRVEISIEGLRDARILQRSIQRLRNDIFPTQNGGGDPAEKSEGE